MHKMAYEMFIVANIPNELTQIETEDLAYQILGLLGKSHSLTTKENILSKTNEKIGFSIEYREDDFFFCLDTHRIVKAVYIRKAGFVLRVMQIGIPRFVEIIEFVIKQFSNCIINLTLSISVRRQ